MVEEEWKACAGIRAIGGGCPERAEKVGSMNVGFQGSTIPKKPGQGGSAVGSRNPNNGVGTLSRVSRL
jgi:hypothetical protein